MGEQRVLIASDPKVMQRFVKNLLRDVQALEYMLKHEWFEDSMQSLYLNFIQLFLILTVGLNIL